MSALEGYEVKVSDEELTAATARLSSIERRLLGTRRRGSKLRYATPHEWAALRRVLLRRAGESNPKLEPELTAYTPGECLALLKHTKVSAWLEWVRGYLVPKGRTIVLVPCAKTKPWSSARVGLYRDYNDLRARRARGDFSPTFFYFATVSEPLGIVPEERWGDFPQYDVPGLFRSESMRTSLFAEEWRDAGFERLLPPWDDLAYRSVINTLGDVIADFLAANEGAPIVSFVEDGTVKGTHSEMLDRACKVLAARGSSPLKGRRFHKRPRARARPGTFIVDTLRRLELLR